MYVHLLELPTVATITYGDSVDARTSGDESAEQYEDGMITYYALFNCIHRL